MRKAGTSRSRPGAITFRGHRRPRLFRVFDDTAILHPINPIIFREISSSKSVVAPWGRQPP